MFCSICCFSNTDVLIPTIASLITFALGWLFTFLYEARKQSRSFRDIRRSVYAWVDSCVVTLRMQIGFIWEYSNKLKESSLLRQEDLLITESSIGRIKEIPIETFIEAFNRLKKVDNASRLIYQLNSSVDYLSGAERDLCGLRQEYAGRMKSTIGAWNAWLHKSREAILSLQREPKMLILYQDVISIFAKWYIAADGCYDLRSVMNDLVTPILASLSQLKGSSFERRMLQSVFEEFVPIYRQWEYDRKAYCDSLNQIANYMSTSVDNILKAKEAFEKKEK